METMLLLGALGAIAAVLYKSIFAAPQQAPVEEKTQPAKKRKAAAKPKAAKKAAAKKAPAKKSAASAKSAETVSHQLKNPETGEVVTVPGSYRFVKRWVKDALVSEGLLKKVYKNNELDDAANKKIKTAIGKLKAIKKYQA